MLRPIYLALFCLLLVGALFAVRATIAARATAEPAFAGSAPGAIPETDDAPPLAKADKLPSVNLDAAKKTVAVIPIEVTPVEKKPRETQKAEETVSWHWHVGSKITKRSGKLAQ
jgi:hypothetical protein